jgi:hypothetical protein
VHQRPLRRCFGVSIVVDHDLTDFHTLDLFWPAVRWITLRAAQFVPTKLRID